ncbi:MAG: glycosyltransferase family 39 protein [Actinomycetes bacterium]
MTEGTGRLPSWAPIVGLLLVTVAGAWLRIAQIRSGLYGDELFAFREIAGATPAQVIDNVLKRSIEVTPPLFFLLANAVARYGDPSVAIRIPSELAGIALIPGVWLLAGQSFSRRAGLIAAAMTAFSVHAIYYSVEARPYALLMLLSGATTWLLLRYLDDRRVRWLAGYAIASSCALYTHYSVVFVLFVQFAWALARNRDQLLRLLAANAVALICFLPWASQVRFKPGARLTMAPFELDWGTASRWLRQLVALPYGDDIPIRQLPGTLPVVILAACIAIAVLASVLKALESRPVPRPSARWVLFLLLAAASPVGMGILSLAEGLEFMQSRYFSASFPALMVLIGVLLNMDGRRLGIALSTIAVGTAAWGAVRATDREYQRPDTGGVVAWIESTAPPDAVLIDRVRLTNGSWVLRPYLADPRRDQPRPPDPRVPDQPVPPDLVAVATRSGKDLVLVTNADSMTQAERALESATNGRFKLVQTASWPGLGGGLRASFFRNESARP